MQIGARKKNVPFDGGIRKGYRYETPNRSSVSKPVCGIHPHGKQISLSKRSRVQPIGYAYNRSPSHTIH